MPLKFKYQNRNRPASLYCYKDYLIKSSHQTKYDYGEEGYRCHLEVEGQTSGLKKQKVKLSTEACPIELLKSALSSRKY